jgi:very-short-patch-repair endonuclease
MSDDTPHKQKQTKWPWKGTVPHEKEAKSHAFAKTLRQRLTDAEVILWQNLRRKELGGLKFRRQHPIGPYITDFACLRAKLIVEVDGATHATETELAHDARRRSFMARFGWKEIRVYNDDVYKNLDGILEAIWREANERIARSTKANLKRD